MSTVYAPGSPVSHSDALYTPQGVQTPENAYNVITANLWVFDARNEVRYNDRAFKNFIGLWNRHAFNTSKRVGSLMSAIGNLPETATRKEWTKYYFTHVRTPEQVVEQVREVAATCDLTFETALNWWWIHIIDSSYSGWLSEVAITKMLRQYSAEHGYSVRKATDEEDRGMGVDAVVEDSEGKTIVGVQIKVKSYFLSTRPSVVEARTVYNPSKYRKFTALHDAPVWYVVIEDSLAQNQLVWKKTQA